MSGVEHWVVETFNGLGQQIGLVYLVQDPGQCTLKVTHFPPPPAPKQPTAFEVIDEAMQDDHDAATIEAALREAGLLRDEPDGD